MFAKANKEGYSIPAFNFNNLRQLPSIANESTPVLLTNSSTSSG
nr:hypothetical protein [Streptobacillus ratti]